MKLQYIAAFVFTTFVFSIEVHSANQCKESKYKIDDESDTDFEDFMNNLEIKTGISKDPYSIVINCGQNKNCIINANGSAVWDARFKLYNNHMTQSGEDNKRKLDDCYCRETIDDFRDCTSQVRQDMNQELDTKFGGYLAEIIEKDGCKNFDENCVTQ